MLTTILKNFFRRDTETPMMILEVSTHHKHPDHEKFRASDAGKCHRMRYWKRQGKEGKQDFSLEVYLALQTGNLLHAFLQYALKQEGVLVTAEPCLMDDHRIGHLDAILRDQGGRLLLYEFKTVGGKQMYYLKQELQPKKEHSYQVRTYEQMYTAFARSETITESIVAYINRDTFEILELPAAGAVSEVYRDWDTLINYWERQETPPMSMNTWECKYCQYNTECAM